MLSMNLVSCCNIFKIKDSVASCILCQFPTFVSRNYQLDIDIDWCPPPFVWTSICRILVKMDLRWDLLWSKKRPALLMMDLSESVRPCSWWWNTSRSGVDDRVDEQTDSRGLYTLHQRLGHLPCFESIRHIDCRWSMIMGFPTFSLSTVGVSIRKLARCSHAFGMNRWQSSRKLWGVGQRCSVSPFSAGSMRPATLQKLSDPCRSVGGSEASHGTQRCRSIYILYIHTHASV